MTATRTDLETPFNEGVAEARVKLGAEVRPIDETMFGLRAVLRAGGQEYSVPDVWNRYHQPFIIGHDRMTPAELVRAIGLAAPDTLKSYRERLERESRERHYIIHHAWDQVRLWDFKRRVLELIVNDIKKHDPKLRKNSNKFKRLAQMVFAEAQVVILKQMSEALNRQIGSLKQHQDESQPGTIAQDAGKLKSAARYLEECAADMAILQPGAEVIEELSTLAGKFAAKASEMLVPVNQAVEDMERVAAVIDQVMVELAKANTARRDWARELNEADSRGLKGIGRKQFEEKAAFALQKAEALQLVVDKMLHAENLLSGEEGMTCDV